MSKKCAILMATYNGQRFLQEQLDSLLTQTYSDFSIRIRDDGSTDSTVEIIKMFAADHPNRIHLDGVNKITIGPCANFSRLLEKTDADYIFFCDQDDIWLPEKLEVLRQRLIAMESMHGENAPLLVHSDLEVVDEYLNVLDSSFWHYQYLCPEKMQTLNRLLVQNYVTGCAMAINRTLASFGPIPKEAIMHDWWLALIATAFGHLEHESTSLIKYRQHTSNDTGAKKWNLKFIARKVKEFFKDPQDRQNQVLITNQTRAFYAKTATALHPEDAKAVKEYLSLEQCNWFQRRIRIIKNGFWKRGVALNIEMLIKI